MQVQEETLVDPSWWKWKIDKSSKKHKTSPMSAWQVLSQLQCLFYKRYSIFAQK